ncbi:MAG: nucleoside triphosphate pyrophosphohydrolase [Firmicutes bacterium]|nr:nucleoside triphosphate pyrophosphohydrolase [Bacillota bacterium]
MYEELYKKGETVGEAAERLKKLMTVLRSENGCPWDREQTHESLRRDMIEEAYEAVDAIDRHHLDNLEEELGDVILQVALHSEIAEEQGEFSFASVMNRVTDKMIHRHPHVFNVSEEKNPENAVFSVDNVLEKWENTKRKEHREATTTESMQKIPRNFPALIRAEKVQKKAARVGFDWDDVGDAFQKIHEEVDELMEAYWKGDHGNIQEEIGDLIFAVVNVARFLRVDPEEALNFTSDKFIRRFSYVEDQAIKAGTRPEEMTLEEMDKLWDDAKRMEK